MNIQCFLLYGNSSITYIKLYTSKFLLSVGVYENVVTEASVEIDTIEAGDNTIP